MGPLKSHITSVTLFGKIVLHVIDLGVLGGDLDHWTGHINLGHNDNVLTEHNREVCQSGGARDDVEIRQEYGDTAKDRQLVGDKRSREGVSGIRRSTAMPVNSGAL